MKAIARIFKLWVALLAISFSALGQTNATDPQVVCVGFSGAYQVDYTENLGAGTLGSSYSWSVITPGFLGNIVTGQGPAGSENRIIINWGATPPGIYQVQIIETNSGCDGVPVLLNVQITPSVIPVTGFSYSTPVCSNSGNLLPNTVPLFTTGGVFSSTPGLVIDPVTGEIDVLGSIPGTYIIGYDIAAGPCLQAGSSTFSITISPTTTNTTTITACDTYTWPVDGNTYTVSGTYTFVTACNTETLDLTITPSTNNTTTITACDTYTWPVDGNTYTTSGIYTFVTACNTETLDLTITPSTNNTTTITACDTYTWPVDGSTYTASGIYTFVTACNTETLDLTITPSTNNTTTITACDTYTWPVDGNTYTVSGTYTFVTACNTETLDLTITPSTNNTTTITACDTYTWPVDGNTYTVSGTYTFVTACNTETLDLTITPSTNNTTTITACDTYTWPVDGNTYTTSGIYTFVTACNTETLDLTITPSTNNTTTITACDTYTWPVDGSTYTVSGTYTFVTACNTETLDLTITPSTNNTTTISACDTYTWSVDGNTYTVSGTYTFVTACNTETLDLTITPSTNNTTTITACDTYTWPVDGNTYTTSGIYTFVTACNTETLDLTITPSTNNTTTITACDTYTWPVDGNTYTVSGTYTFVTACNTETLDLTITPSTNNTTTITACDTYTWPVDGNTYTTSGIYTFVTACNTETLDLTITPSTNNTTTITACDTYTWPVDGNTYTTSGIYTFVTACNTETLDLTITPSTNNTTTISACDTYTWPVDGNTYTTSGIYTFVTACNTETLDLTITPSTNNTTTITACDTYTWPVDGNTYTVSGTYTFVTACNTETLDLTITPSTNNTTTITACDTYTWPVDGNTYTTSGIYTFVTACNTETLDLTITPSTNNTTTITACDTYTWPVDGNTYTTSGIYTFVTACNTETLDLTITPSTNNTTTISACDTYTWPVDGNTYTASGTYTFVTVCNTETLDLTITPSTNNTTTITACDTYTWPVDGNTYTVSGTYTFVTACNTETLDLTITPSTNNTTTITACDTYTWPVDGNTYTTSGIYTFVTACNTETLDLTITPSTNNTTTISACDTYTWPVDGNTYTASGTYTFVTACNTETLDLTITPSTNNTTTITACDTYTWPVDGNTYTASGIYTFVTACNTETLDLTITPSTNNTTTISACDTYTWPVDGNTYTTSGIYTFVTACNTETLDLTITPSTNNTTTISACDTYTWPVDGNTYTTSGIYTFVTACNTETLDLTITPSTNNTTTISACDTYTWPVDGNTYTTSGIYTFVTACNTETLDLTITPSTNNTTTITACDTYTWPIDGNTYTVSGTYTFATACNTETLDLTITPSTNNTTTISACDTYTWPVDGNTYTTSGIYTFVTACNTETLDLTITPSTNNTTTITACDTYTWPVDGNTYTVSGTYTFVTACNTETLDLTITPSTNNTTTITACDTYTWPVDGNTYTTSGIYTFVTACNTETLDLTITPSTNNTTTISACDTYTWPVDGNTYTASGTYTFVTACNTETLDLTINTTPALTNVNAQICNGQSYTLPDGSTVNTSGSYSVTLTSAGGCDSIVTTDLIVVPVITNTVNAQICNGQSYTLPDGSTVNTSGSYSVTLTSAGGCDSIVTTDLIVVPVITNTVNAQICNGQSYTLPDGSTVNTSGSYSVTLVSAGGCDSIVTTDLIVVPVITNTVNAQICNGQSYTLPDGSTVNTSGSYSVTLVSAGGCDSIVTTDLIVVPVITNTVNAQICNGQSYTLPDGSTVNTSGSYSVTLTSAGGCDSIVTTDLIVVPVITNTVNAQICNGQSYTLPDGSTVNTSGSYSVTLVSAGGCDSIVTTDLIVVPVITNTVNAQICNGQSYTLPDGSTVNTSGSYSVTLTSAGGCDSIVTTDLIVVPVITNTVNAQICNGQSYTLPDGSTVNTSGSYSVTLTSAGGCDSIVTTDLIVVPVITNTVNAQICNGQSYTLPDGSTVNTSGSYPVTLVSAGGCDSIVTTDLIVVPVITNTVNAQICNGQSYTLPDGSTVNTSGSYPVTLVSAGGCDSIVTTDLIVVPVITNTVNAQICNGQSYTLPDGSTVNTSGSYSVTLVSAGGCDSIVTTDLIVVPVITNTVNAQICNGQSYTLPDGSTVNTSGSYSVTLTSAGGCDSIVTTDLIVVPVITNTVNAQICNGQSYTLPDGSTVNTSGSYSVTLVSAGGCDSIVTTDLIVVPVITNTVNAQICNGQSYTLPDGSTVNTSGSYPVTLVSAGGCDSIVTTDLIVVPVITNTVNAQICNGQSYTLPDGSTVNTSGSYSVTLTSAGGCDSIVTTDLIVVPVITNTVNAQICNGQSYTLPDGSTVNTSGSYSVTLVSAGGCDSIVTTDLIVVPVITNTVNAQICNGQSYTLPDGSTVNTSGSYPVTLVSAGGCDSIVTTDLIVVPVITNTVNAQICNGQSYTLPDGSTVNTSGSYSVTLVSAGGCDSIVTTDLIVVPVITNTVNAQICNGQSYTLPDGSTVNTSGSYSVTLVSAGGCDSIVTTDLIVVPVITNTVNAQICNGQSYTLPDGSTVNTSGSYPVTLTSSGGCDSIVTTDLIVVPVITNTVNAQICNGQSYTLPDGSTVNTSGSYSVTLTSAGGCDSIVTTDLLVVPVITNTVNAQICNGQSYTLPDGSTVNTSGSYSVTLTSAGGCDSIVTTDLLVVPVITNTVNAQICNGQPYTLPDGSTVNTSGSYPVTLVSSGGCDSIVTTDLIVVPVITNTVNAQICNGQSYTLPDGSTVNTSGSYPVTLVSAGGCDSIVTTDLIVVPVITNTVNAQICNGQSYTLPDGSTVNTSGSYSVTLTSAGGCDSIVTTDLIVVPVITNTVNAQICNGQSYTLPDGSTVNTSGSYPVTLVSAGGCDSIVTTDLIVVPVITNTVNAQICNGQSYTLPDGSTVNTSGSYSVTLTSAGGCDSIVTTDLIVVPVITNTVNAQICNGQSYTLPDGSTVNTSGSYSVTLTSAGGCDSIVTTDLIVVPVITNTVNAQICNGQSYTLPDGSTVNTSGSYSVTLVSAGGCDSIVTTDLIVVPVITNTVNAQICNGQSYTLPDGSTVNTSGSYPVTLVSAGGCDSIVTTDLIVVPVITNTVNAQICNGQSYTLPDGSTVNTSGSYSVTLTSAGGCDSIVTTDLIVVPVITNTVNAQICNGQSYTLPDGSTVNTSGSYPVTLTSAGGCDSIVTTDLIVVPVITNTVNAQICNGQSYTLPDGSTVNTSGSYSVTLTSAGGCDSIVTTDLIVVPVITNTVNAQICNGQSYTLPDGSTVNTSGSYSITLVSSGGCDSIVTTDLIVVPVITNTVNAQICNGQSYTLPDGSTVNTSGSYSVTLASAGGCDSIVTTDLIVVPVITNTVNAQICNGQSYTLPDGSTVNTSGSYAVTLVSAGGCDSIVTTDLIVVPVITNTVNAQICNGQSYTLPDGSTVNTSGSYPVTLTSAGGCDSIVTTDLIVVPVITNTVNAQICNGQSYTLPDGSTVNTSGSYSVTLVSAGGCDSIVTTDLIVVPVITNTVNAQICNGQSYTLPDGSTVNTSGSYPVTLTSAGGCDSIVTTDLIVVPVITNTVNAQICNGQSYTLPDGSTVNTSGSYSVTLTSAGGCDSIVTTDLIVVPVITNTVNAQICNGQSYTLPDGSTVNTSGSYSVTLVSAGGCDSIVTTDLIVVPVITNTVNAQICNGQSYTLPDGSTVNTSGSYPVTLVSAGGCDSIVTTDLIVVPVITNTVNAQICNGQSYTLPDGSTVNTSGSYSVTLTSAGGCDSIVTTDLIVVPVITNTVNAQICNGQSYTLPDGSTVNTSGSYPVTLVSAGGCDSIVTTDLIVVPVITNTVNAQICNGQSYTLPDGSTVNTSGSYSVTLTSAGGCDSIVTTDLIVVPVITNTVNAQICNGQSYTLPDGNTVNTSGSYPVTLVSAGGCDSIVTTDLIVVPVITNTVNAQICNGQSYTLPDGSTVNTSGSYPVTLVSAGGCDSIVTTDLIVVPVVTTNVNVQICTGQSYTLPDGNTINTAGSYPVTLFNQLGCDSIVVTNLSLLPNVSPSVTISSFPPTAVCQGTNLLFVASPVNGGTAPVYQWLINGVAIPMQNNDSLLINTLNNGDSVAVQMISNDSCVSPASVLSNVLVPSLIPLLTPSVSISSSPVGVQCAGTAITFTSSVINAGTNPVYQWYVNANPVGTGLPTYTDSLLNDGDMVYVTMASSEFCITDTISFSNQITQNITSFLTPSVTLLPLDSLPACQGMPVTFNAIPVNGGSNPTYQWFVNGIPVIGVSGDVFSTSNLNDGDVVSVQMNSSLSCATPDSALSNSFQQTIIPISTPSISITSSPSGVQCSSVPITFTAVPVNGGTNPAYQWFINLVPVQGQNSLTFTTSGLNNGDVISVGMISNMPCSDTTMVYSNTILQSIITTLTPSVTITSDRLFVCDEQPVNFVATASNTGNQPLFNWFVNDVLIQSSASPLFSYAQFNNEDVVTCQLMSSFVCVSSDTVTSNAITIHVNPLPYINLPHEYTSFIGDSVQLVSDGTIDNVQYSWSPSLYLDCPTCITPISNPYDPMVYYVTITDTLTGCSVTDSLIINLITDVEVFIPSGFSPNGDGYNDVLYVRGYNIVNFVLRIYDRFGELVFQTQSFSTGWDGTYRGKEANAGVYYYYFDYNLAQKPEVNLEGDESLSKKGSITLVR